MTTTEIVLVGIAAIILLIQILLWRRGSRGSDGQQSHVVQQQLQQFREETAKSSRDLREEVSNSISKGYDNLAKALGEMGRAQVAQLTAVQTIVKDLVETNRAQIERLQDGVGEQLKEMRSGNEAKLVAIQQQVRGLTESNQAQIDRLQQSVAEKLVEVRSGNEQKLTQIQEHIKGLTESNQGQIERLQKTIAEQLKELQTSNETKLDQMRQTVDEKLQSTLEKRLGESFKLVSERLEAVQRGLGEMKDLADGVGDLKRVLTNVKARGTWGEVQLGAILEQLLTDDQYEANVMTKQGTNNLVEFAIKLPGADDDPGKPVYLPIDSKFPQEDYLKLLDASERADAAGVEESSRALVRAIKLSAKDISEKYIDPPHTTDFAIMFLPTEGLYAEVLRQPGLMEDLQSSNRIVVTGPTTLSATVSSLRLGFRTLAIEKRSAEVWQVLAAVKTEFGKFGTVLERVKKQLGTVTKTIGETEKRTRAMERKMRSVESMPAEESSALLGLDDQADGIDDESEDKLVEMSEE
jgi:DNA recombination protein RmuC